MSKEAADLAEKDSVVLEEMSVLMSNYAWNVNSCGKDGNIDMEKIRKLAPSVLKIIVNYIR